MSDEVEWRDIPGYEGSYQVSRCGRVHSLDRVITCANRWGGVSDVRRKGKELTPCKTSNGYIQVHLGAEVLCRVHHLVALAFVPGDTSLQVNHKNGKRDDNRAENLEWLTCSDNHLHSYRELSRKKHCKTTPVWVGNTRYSSLIEAAKALGVSQGSIHSALTRNHRCCGLRVYE